VEGEKYIFRIKYGVSGEEGQYGPKTLTDSLASLTL
jgi:hypothetical protein